MMIDCDACAVRDLQCGDCVMTVLLATDDRHERAPQRGPVEVDDAEARALAALADSGLVPHLKLVPLGLPRAEAG